MFAEVKSIFISVIYFFFFIANYYLTFLFAVELLRLNPLPV